MFSSKTRWFRDYTNQCRFGEFFNSLLTLHDYLYASANPINGLDPSGRFTMTNVMGGFNTAMNAVSNITFVTSLFSQEDDDDDQDRGSSLWDALMNSALGGGGGLLNAAIGMAATDGGSYRDSPHRHHTIPVYLCGKNRASNLALISSAKHTRLHRLLDYTPLVINSTGKTIELILSRGRAKSNRPVLTKYLSNPSNRKVMVGILDAFYQFYGFNDLRDLATGKNFGSVFHKEAFDYSRFRSATSLPHCTKVPGL